MPLNALFPGFKGGLLITFPLIRKDSIKELPGIGIPLSPSQAKKPILASTLSITFNAFRVTFKLFCKLETTCMPS